MNNDNSTFEFEGRQYVNPDISRDEQMAFIDTMRDMQAQNNAQIAAETYNLGTDVEPIRGGLSGSEEYWKGRYQTPQTEAAVANMKAVAQQTALNNALSNYSDMLQNRYNQAYRAYQKRAYNYNRRGGSGGSGGGSGDNTSGWDGETSLETDDAGRYALNIGGVTYYKIVDDNGAVHYEDANGNTIEKPSAPSAPPRKSNYTVSKDDVKNAITQKSPLPDWLDSIVLNGPTGWVLGL